MSQESQFSKNFFLAMHVSVHIIKFTKPTVTILVLNSLGTKKMTSLLLDRGLLLKTCNHCLSILFFIDLLVEQMRRKVIRWSHSYPTGTHFFDHPASGKYNYSLIVRFPTLSMFLSDQIDGHSRSVRGEAAFRTQPMKQIDV